MHSTHLHVKIQMRDDKIGVTFQTEYKSSIDNLYSIARQDVTESVYVEIHIFACLDYKTLALIKMWFVDVFEGCQIVLASTDIKFLCCSAADK